MALALIPGPQEINGSVQSLVKHKDVSIKTFYLVFKNLRREYDFVKL